MLKIATCYLSGYQEAGKTQTYSYPTAVSAYLTPVEGGSGSSWPKCSPSHDARRVLQLFSPLGPELEADIQRYPRSAFSRRLGSLKDPFILGFVGLIPPLLR